MNLKEIIQNEESQYKKDIYLGSAPPSPPIKAPAYRPLSPNVRTEGLV